ncbi:MAG: DUF6515 family protein [Ferruginibacter sp.]
MKTSTQVYRLLAVLGVALILSSGTYAQNNRGRNDRDRRYGNYHSSRPRVNIGIGINPYYNFRPVTRHRIYYRPSYRLPYRYNHFGPAFGIRINVLPFGYSRFFIGPDPFYYYDGIYYRPYKSGGYTVTQAPLGAIVKHLPSGAKVTVIDGQKYYELGGTFYQERITANNKLRYEVVGTDGVLNTTNADADDEDEDAVQAPATQGNTNTQAPVNGSIVTQLPAGCNNVIINQQKYFLSPAGVYYQELTDGTTVSYKVAGTSAAGTQ